MLRLCFAKIKPNVSGCLLGISVLVQISGKWFNHRLGGGKDYVKDG